MSTVADPAGRRVREPGVRGATHALAVDDRHNLGPRYVTACQPGGGGLVMTWTILPPGTRLTCERCLELEGKP